MTCCLKRPILPGMKELFTVANRAYLSERRLAARGCAGSRAGLRCGSSFKVTLLLIVLGVPGPVVIHLIQRLLMGTETGEGEATDGFECVLRFLQQMAGGFFFV